MSRRHGGKTVKSNRTDAREVAVFRSGKSKETVAASRPLTVRVREDVAPRMNDMMRTASIRTAPARAEAMARGSAAWNALKGEYYPRVTVEKQEKKRGGRGMMSGGRGMMISAVGTAAAAGAAAWAASKRSRPPEWVSTPERAADESAMPEGAAQRATAQDRGAASPDELVADTSYRTSSQDR